IAGETNAGKTPLIYWMMRANAEHLLRERRLSWSTIYIDKEKDMLNPTDAIGIRYLSSEMGPRAIRRKINKFKDKNILDLFYKHITIGEFTDAPQDKLDHSGINFIDFLEAKDGDFFKLGGQITSIFQSLSTGIAVIGIQKKKGSDVARGGELTHEKPRLVLALYDHQ